MELFPKEPRTLPPGTRGEILRAAFRVFCRRGFQGAGLSTVLAELETTKGALYHHFESKQALGYAVVEEIVRPWVFDRWVEPLRQATDPLAELVRRVEALAELPIERHRIGCPLNTLAQEMSGLDEGFRTRLNGIYDDWRAALARLLERERARGRVAADVQPEETAAFVVAAVEGTMSLSKTDGDLRQVRQTVAALVRYLRSLRA